MWHYTQARLVRIYERMRTCWGKSNYICSLFLKKCINIYTQAIKSEATFENASKGDLCLL